MNDKLLQFTANISSMALQVNVRRLWLHELSTPRYADPKRLIRYGFKVYSQNDEDGIIQEIFKRIGPTSRSFIEFGVQTGVECNTAKLLLEGWRGLWIEGGSHYVAEVRLSLGSSATSG